MSTAPVEIGILYRDYQSAQALYTAAGANGLDLGDPHAQVQAIINWVNARGGLLGRKIVPVYYAFDVSRSEPYSVQIQEMCSKWTQDHHVVAAYTPDNMDWDQLARCLEKQQALFDGTGSRVRSRTNYQISPYWFELNQILIQRMSAPYVATLQQLGYFEKDAKIGLLEYDNGPSQEWGKLIRAEMSRRGLKVHDSYTMQLPRATNELGNWGASAQSAVLRFRSSGVTHVFSLAPQSLFVFGPAAESQNYRPRYGLNSIDALTPFIAANVPKDQLRGAVAMGWGPLVDVNEAHHPGFNATAVKCRKILRESGASTNYSQDATGMAYCGFILMLRAAADLLPAGTPVNGVSLLQGLERLGASYQSPVTMSTFLSPSHHDGVAAVRGVRFDSDGCECWVYVGGLRRI